MKPKDLLTQDAGFVRDLCNLCAIDYPADDTERAARDAFFRKAYQDISDQALEVQHVRRIHEALCQMKFPTSAALAARQAALLFLANHHQLKRYRAVKLPAITPPKPALAA